MKEALMTGKQNSKPESDDIHRFAMIMRMLAVAVVILLVMCDRGHAQTKIVWSAFSSGTTIQSDKGTNIVSILGDPFFGSGSAGSIVLTTGFGPFILDKGVVSEISNSIPGVPVVYSLSQNYPNPFNPSTTIAFTLPSRSFVTLKIFDLIGRETATILSGELEAGKHTRQWNAQGFPSGMYVCRLEAGGFVDMKKLLLLK